MYYHVKYALIQRKFSIQTKIIAVVFLLLLLIGKKFLYGFIITFHRIDLYFVSDFSYKSDFEF